jgi:hypothetical protein
VNYLAHAWVLPDLRPALVLGAALPDLLGSFDRRAPRLGAEAPARLLAIGPRDVARGVRAHQAADATFHELDAFREGCDALKPLVARLAERGARVRGFFVTHLLLEMLLDAALLEVEPGLARSFYDALERSDVAAAVRATSEAAGTPADPAAFAAFFGRFRSWRFLEDYATDDGLAHRLGQVLARARQDLGPGRATLVAELPAARALVRARREALVAEPRAHVARALADL